jgi:sugar phosphate isomerase/epimerase
VKSNTSTENVIAKDCPFSRRTFLASAAAAVATGRFANAADPPARTGRPYMKLGLAGYSFNRQMARRGTREAIAKAEMNLEKFIDYCAKLDLDACELTAYYFPQTVTQDDLLRVKEHTFRLGLDISGTAIGNNFCLPEGEARDRELAETREWIDHAAVMGAPHIRIFAGTTPKGDTESVAIARCIKGINESVAYAATKGVVLGLENHGGVTANPDTMLDIVKAVDPSPWFGVNLDSGNFQIDDPYAGLAKIAPYTVNAQIKVMMRPNGVHEPADFDRIIGILKDAGYRGYVVLEYEESADPFEAIPRHIDALRKSIGD